MPSIAEQLLAVLRAAPLPGPYRSKCLAELQVRFVHNGTLHQVAEFDRRSGTWVSGCGISYEGNGYVEDSHPGQTDCVLCLAGADDVGR